MGKNDDLAEQILRTYAEARAKDGVIFMTYGDLATRLGRPGQHRLLGDPLDRLRRLCEKRHLPDVATMIVDKTSLREKVTVADAGKVEPSPKALEKYGGWLDLRAEQARVIAFDWSSLL